MMRMDVTQPETDADTRRVSRTSTPVRVVTVSCHEPAAATCTSPTTSLCVPIWHSPSSTMNSSIAGGDGLESRRPGACA